MFPTKMTIVRLSGVALVAALSTGCATYGDEFAAIDSRLDALESRVEGAAQSADSASREAARANQRLDSLEGRVQQLETRNPRG